jgi:Skp family chaperone for outer membrane proteins
MKKITMMALAALLMLNSAAALAQETPQEQYLCKVQAGNCLTRVDRIQRKMKKLEAETKKGKVYSAEDLKKIEDKLKEVEQMLDNLKAKPAK